MNNRHPRIGEELIVGFSETDLRSAIVMAHSEMEAWPGACDMTTEFLIIKIGAEELSLTRHSILPEEEQDWNIDGTCQMVTIFTPPGPFQKSKIERSMANAGNQASPDA